MTTLVERDHVAIRLEERALRTIEVGGCMRYAAQHGLLQSIRGESLRRAAS